MRVRRRVKRKQIKQDAAYKIFVKRVHEYLDWGNSFESALRHGYNYNLCQRWVNRFEDENPEYYI